MRESGVDLRPPSVYESWFWVLDTSQLGSEGQWLPSGENLGDERYALLLEYLPDAKRFGSITIDRELALKALAGAQSIQRALVRHGDQAKRNLLVTGKGRVVWIDFDRSQVQNQITEDLLVRFKKDLIEIYDMLFIDEGLVTNANSSAASTLSRK